jgi:hypothetical protein
MRLERQDMVIRDVNDGSRVFNISGSFPFVAGPTTLQLPTTQALAGVRSLLPVNVASQETDVEAFDFIIENNNPAGFTNIELKTLRVAIDGRDGNTLNTSTVLSAARLITRDSTIVAATIGAAEIVFSLPDDLVDVAPESSDSMTIVVDIGTSGLNSSFRFSIKDTASLDVFDQVSGAPVPVGTIDGTGFPLASRWTNVLGASSEAAFTNYPNPFAAGREHTTITYYLAERSTVTLKLYTLWGAPVTTLVKGITLDAGLYQNTLWDGRTGGGETVNNGVYILVLETNGEGGARATLKRKVAVVR